MTAVVDAALYWLEQGIVPIPCRFRTKTPVVKWGEWTHKLPPAALVRRWFGGLYNIALITNEHYVVVDFDDLDAYDAWVADHARVAVTRTIRSRRGVHLHYRVNAPAHTIAFAGGDLLASGHLVTVPPSVHESGHVYTVLRDVDPIAIPTTRMLHLPVPPVDPDAAQALVRGFTATGPSLPVYLMPSPVDVSGSLIERIKRAVPLTDYLGRLTRLVRMGKRLMALCPFHPDTHPSMAVYADQGACYCYANQCPAHRRLDVIDVASLVWHTSTRDAARLLAQEYGL